MLDGWRRRLVISCLASLSLAEVFARARHQLTDDEQAEVAAALGLEPEPPNAT